MFKGVIASAILSLSSKSLNNRSNKEKYRLCFHGKILILTKIINLKIVMWSFLQSVLQFLG